MRCKCGNQIDNVPEHLVDLATWICSKCTNAAARQGQAGLDQMEDEPLRKQVADKDPKKAA